jgi:hypothetical protein
VKRNLSIQLFLTSVVTFPIWFGPVRTASINVSEGRAPWVEKDKEFVLLIEAAKLAQHGYTFEDARQRLIDGRAEAERIREIKIQGMNEFFTRAWGFIVLTGLLVLIWRTPFSKS